MRCSTTVCTCLIISVLCSSAIAQDTDAINTRINAQQARLKVIEESFQNRRQQAEDLYKEHLNELWELAVFYAHKFETHEHVVWTEFAKLHNQAKYAKDYAYYIKIQLEETKAHRSLEWDEKLRENFDRKLRNEMRDRYYEDCMARFLLDNKAEETVLEIVTGKIVTRKNESHLRTEARKVLRIIEILQSRREGIETRYKESLEKLSVLRKIEKDKVYKIIDGIKPVQIETGVISAIYYGNRPVVMIEGVDESIVYEGQKVNDIKVVKVYPDKVKFRKGLKSWVQKVGKPANVAWKSF